MSAHCLPVMWFALITLTATSAAAQGESDPSRISTTSFSVTPPQGKGWSWTMRPDSLGIELRRHKGGVSGLLGLSTPEELSIAVLLNFTNRENAARGAEAVAHDFIDQEEAQLRALTTRSFSQEVTLKRAERRIDSIGAYRVHVFEAQVRVADFAGTVQEDQTLFLYFPPDFGDHQQFFIFQMSRVRPNKHGWDKNGFNALRQMVESFRDERPEDSPDQEPPSALAPGWKTPPN